jgi:glycosyltransferase involved in cell wall biosynthesis
MQERNDIISAYLVDMIESCHTESMISVIVPTSNSADTLPSVLDGLIPAAVQGLVREVIVVDHGSTDGTIAIAEGYGAEIVHAGPTRAARLMAGAQRAKFQWLLFLNPDATPEAGFERELETFVEAVESGRRRPAAAVFKFQIGDDGVAARVVERLTAASCSIFGCANSENGLLIQRSLYTEVGGYRATPVLEDVDLTRRIGRGRLVRLRRPLVSDAKTFRADGYFWPTLRYMGSVVLYALNVPLTRIAAIMGTTPRSARA